MPFCPKCGAEVKADVRFCPECGQAMKPHESKAPSWPPQPIASQRRSHTNRNAAIFLLAVLALIIVFILLTSR